MEAAPNGWDDKTPTDERGKEEAVAWWLQVGPGSRLAARALGSADPPGVRFLASAPRQRCLLREPPIPAEFPNAEEGGKAWRDIQSALSPDRVLLDIQAAQSKAAQALGGPTYRVMSTMGALYEKVYKPHLQGPGKGGKEPTGRAGKE